MADQFRQARHLFRAAVTVAIGPCRQMAAFSAVKRLRLRHLSMCHLFNRHGADR
ncbi:hypothetical protein [Teichococcus vastitatis]|uniref:Uncharacterized protein n=1 Tax=Teichococcus vastitatis TaxID=2307076 RepID=A0ABS9W000_9PROT|nr:hypothetical protein [Pseudoroseomonas vastitatis]MCI0752617.1 hypothetical protein [Pseudoroseomonas vastitatis]